MHLPSGSERFQLLFHHEWTVFINQRLIVLAFLRKRMRAVCYASFTSRCSGEDLLYVSHLDQDCATVANVLGLMSHHELV